MSVGSDVTLSI